MKLFNIAYIAIVLNLALFMNNTYAQTNLWTYEEKFNTLTNGDINGQDSWVVIGGGAGDVAQVVITGTPYEGAKHFLLQDNSSSGYNCNNAKRSITGIANGTVYFSLKKAFNTAFAFFLENQINQTVIDLALPPDGKIKSYQNNGPAYEQIDNLTYNADTYYRFGIAFETGSGLWEGLSASTWKLTMDGGVTWSSPQAFEYRSTSATSITGIYLQVCGNIDGINTYFDYISPNYTDPPTITLGSNAPSTASQCAGTTKVTIQSFSLAVTNANGNLTDVGFTTTGSYAQTDIAKYQLWYRATTNDISGASQLGTDLVSSGNAGARAFAPFSSPTLTVGTTYYFWITADIAVGAANNNTIAVNAIAATNLTSTSNKAGSASAGDTQTIKALPTVSFTAQPGASACIGVDVTYTTQTGMSNYVWVVPGTLSSDYSITSGGTGTTSNTVTLKWLTTGSKTVTINYTDGNGCTPASAISSTATTVNAPATATVDWNNSNIQEITLSTCRSLTFTNGKSGGIYTLLIKQNSSGGWAVIWPANVKWAGGIAPTLTTSADAADMLRFMFDGTNYLDAAVRLDIK